MKYEQHHSPHKKIGKKGHLANRDLHSMDSVMNLSTLDGLRNVTPEHGSACIARVNLKWWSQAQNSVFGHGLKHI